LDTVASFCGNFPILRKQAQGGVLLVLLVEDLQRLAPYRFLAIVNLPPRYSTLHWPWENISTAYAFQSARSSQSDGFVHRDSNENSYGPSSKVAEAIRSTTSLVNRYPFRKYNELTERIASFHQ